MSAAEPALFRCAPPVGLPDILACDALTLSRRIRAREHSCVELMQATLAHIEALNPRFNPLVSCIEPELAARGARERPLLTRPLAGLDARFPQAPKDLTAVAGMPTTLGSRALAHHVTGHDSAVVERLRREGAILIGRSNTPEFGLGSHTYNPLHGTTGNAYDPARSAGGSSGGAAVALALHLLPVADGSDMMGSLRNPAAWNNVYGLRPGFGRVPMAPAADVFYQQLATEGPMARNPQDLAWLLSTLAGPDARAPLSLRETRCSSASPGLRDPGWRIGWLGDLGGHLPMEPGLLALQQQALAHFDTLGCVVEPVSPGFDMAGLWRCWCTLRQLMLAGHLAALYADPASRALLKPEAVWEFEQSQRLDAAAVAEAFATAAPGMRPCWRCSSTTTTWCCRRPSAPFDARLHWPAQIAGRAMDSYHRWMEVVIGPSLAGLPTAGVPAGFDAAGLPHGLQIMARPQAEWALLQLCAAWHEATPWRQRRAPVLQTPPT
jgi:amidase